MRRASHRTGAGIGLKARAAAAAIAALIIAGCGGGQARSPQPATLTGGIGAPQPATHHKPRPKPTPPGLTRLRNELLKALAKAGPQTGAAVYDLGTRTPLFELRATVQRPPASVEKLYTTVALLHDLGPGATFQTTLLGAGYLGPRGIWHGTLYLKGGGDPTFGDGAFNRTWEDGFGPTANDLVAQLRAKGIRRVTGRVIADESRFDGLRGAPNSHFNPDIPDIGGELSALTYDHGSVGDGRLSPAAFATHELVLTMRGAHIHARASAASATAPPGARPLATVSSPPLSTLIQLMNVPSDDFFAEMLTKQLGVQQTASGTTAAGAAAIHQAIATTYDVHPRIVDGSGLSREDRSSPLQVVDLLAKLWHTPTGDLLAAALPTVGVNGTTRRIARNTPAQGNCIAKTGTLDYVTNLAGYCHSRGNRHLAFALFVDGPPNWIAIRTLSAAVAAIARY